MEQIFTSIFQNEYYSKQWKVRGSSSLYIEVKGKMCDISDQDKDFGMVEKLLEILQTNNSIVLGSSGNGKTVLAQHLCHILLLQKGTNNALPFPIYVPLRSLEKIQNDSPVKLNFWESLLKLHFKYFTNDTEKVYIQLRTTPITLILDGYDELKNQSNMWKDNEWDKNLIRTITFSRPNAMTMSSFQQRFPQTQFLVLKPFDNTQVNEYLEKTVRFLREMNFAIEQLENPQEPWLMTKQVTSNNLDWETNSAKYKFWILQILPELQNISQTPYLFTMILQMLPSIVEKYEDEEAVESNVKRICSTEVEVFDNFVSSWFDYQVLRVKGSGSNEDICNLSEAQLKLFFWSYAQNLSTNSIRERDGTISQLKSEKWDLWIPNTDQVPSLTQQQLSTTFIFPSDDLDKDDRKMNNLRLLRNACLLNCNPVEENVNEYTFFHLSLVEYFVSRETFMGLRAQLNYHVNNEALHKSVKYFPFSQTNINDRQYKTMRKLLGQRAKHNQEFRQLLLNVIKQSSDISNIKMMSSNAISILNLSGYNFSGFKFQNIQVPGANLSNSICGNVDFRGANLSNVNLSQGYYSGSQFQGANLFGSKFGQKPPIKLQAYNSNSFILLPYSCKEENNCPHVLTYQEEEGVWDYCMDFVHPPFCKLKETDKGNPEVIVNFAAFLAIIDESIVLFQEEDEGIKWFSSPTSLNKKLKLQNSFNIADFTCKEKCTRVCLNKGKCGKYQVKTVEKALKNSMHVISTNIFNSSKQPTLFVTNRRDATFFKQRLQLFNHEVRLELSFEEKESASYFDLMCTPEDELLLAFSTQKSIVIADIYKSRILIEIEDVKPPSEFYQDNFSDPQFSFDGAFLLYMKSDNRKICIWSRIKNRSVEINNSENTEYFSFQIDSSHKFLAYSTDSYHITICSPYNPIPLLKTRADITPYEVPNYFFTTNSSCLHLIYLHDHQIKTLEVGENNLIVKEEERLANVISNDGLRKASILYSTDGILEIQIHSISPENDKQSLLFSTQLSTKQLTFSGCLFTQSYYLVFNSKNVIYFFDHVNGLVNKLFDVQLVDKYNSHYLFYFDQIHGRVVHKSEKSLKLYSIFENDGKVKMEIVNELNVEMENNFGLISYDVCDSNSVFFTTFGKEMNIMRWNTLLNSHEMLVPESEIKKVFPKEKSIDITKIMSYECKKKVVLKKYHFIQISGHCFKISSGRKLKPVKLFARPKDRVYKRIAKLNLGFGTYENFVHIIDLNKMKLLLTINVPHVVSDFKIFLSNEASFMYLYVWDKFGEFSCFSINHKQLNTGDENTCWKLLWSKNPSSSLLFNSASIGKCHGLSEVDAHLLKSSEVIGIPTKTGRYDAFPDLFKMVTESNYSVLATNGKAIELSNQWILSVVARIRKNRIGKPKMSNHVGFAVEGIRNSRHFALKADLTYITKTDQVVILMKSLDKKSDYEKMAKNMVARQWVITSEEGMKVINSVREDQWRDLSYHLLNANCATWCREKLALINKTVDDDNKSWKRILVPHDLPQDFFKKEKFRLNLNFPVSCK